MWEDIFNSFFSSQSANQEGQNKGSFGGAQVPPEIPDWVRQFMASPFTEGRNKVSQQDLKNNDNSFQSMYSQWPFSTLKDNPFEIFSRNPSASDDAQSSRRNSGSTGGKSRPFER